MDLAERKEKVKRICILHRKRNRLKTDLLNLKKTSTSFTQHMKPIHEIECEDGTITQDPEIMKEEGHRFASDRFQGPNNNQASQMHNIKQVE